MARFGTKIQNVCAYVLTSSMAETSLYRHILTNPDINMRDFHRNKNISVCKNFKKSYVLCRVWRRTWGILCLLRVNEVVGFFLKPKHGISNQIQLSRKYWFSLEFTWSIHKSIIFWSRLIRRRQCIPLLKLNSQLSHGMHS